MTPNPTVSSPSLWFGSSGPHNAQIAIVGESWGEKESQLRQPFVGFSGNELTKILTEAGIARNNCFITNIISEQPPRNEMSEFFIDTTEARKNHYNSVRGLFPKQNVINSLERLHQQLATVNPKIIIGLGNYTLWALTNDNFSIKDEDGKKTPTGISNWRGSQLYTSVSGIPRIPFLPTYHPAAALRNWPWRYDLVHDIRARVSKALTGKWNQPQYNFLVRPSFHECAETLETLTLRAETSMLLLAVDLETRASHIACIGLGWSRTDAMCIPLICHGMQPYWSLEQETLIVQMLRRLLSHPNLRIIGQNFLYDAQYITLFWGIKVQCWFDTMLMQHLCWPGKPKSLAYISSLYNNFHSFWKDEGKEMHPTFNDEQHWSYNCKDCVATFEAHEHLNALIDKLGLRDQATLQMQQFPMVLEMMLRGVRVDLEARARLTGEIGIEMKKITDRLKSLMPSTSTTGKKTSPWYTSPKQQQELFYDMIGVREVLDPKTKRRTVDDEALELIAGREPVLRPIIEMLQDLRSMRIFHKNFICAELDADNRMRCSYDPSGTVTFRWNSSKNAFGNGTNLQNLPKGTEE